MAKGQIRNHIRHLEIYSMTQGALLVFLAAWFRFGLRVVQMEVPAPQSPYNSRINCLPMAYSPCFSVRLFWFDLFYAAGLMFIGESIARAWILS